MKYSVAMESVQYYLHNFWQEHGEPKVATDFPLMYGGPWKLFAILAIYAYASLRVGPKWMRDRKPYDLRPFMLIYNGFMFGVNGAGFLVALWVTQLGTNSWSCSMDSERWSGIQGTVMVYLGYIYMGIRLGFCVNTAFNILRKKEGYDLKAEVIHNCYLVLFAYSGLKFYPRGIFCFLPLTDTFVQSVRCAYLVLASAGNGLKFALWWKQHVTQVQLFQQTILMIHTLYVFLTPQCAGPTLMKMIVFLYVIGTFPYCVSFYRRNFLSTRRTIAVTPAQKAQ